MSERIRYRKLKEDLLESTQVFKHATNGSQYKVLHNLKDHQWMVIDAHTELVAASGHNVKKAKAQADVRKALTGLGISISKEQRERSKSKLS